MSRLLLNIFKGWRFHNLSGQPVPVLGHPHRENEFPSSVDNSLSKSLPLFLSC